MGIRHDFFQTATQVTVSLYAKGVQPDDVTAATTADSLRVTIAAREGAAAESLTLSPLAGSIVPGSECVQVLRTKVDVTLDKAPPLATWPALTGAHAVAPVREASPARASAPRGPSKWDALAREGGDEPDAAAGDEELNAFFRKLYAGADDDTRRAMMKSFQESNGTALSTNWSEVGKDRVEVKPPAGMQPRRYEQ
ncbi:Cochaperone protein [Malassezia sp. CBS 17886]|nr:Cochaperone protein [Malassezia sp. CBS 17886]